MSKSSSKYSLGIRDPEKTHSGSRIQGSKRHRIPDPEEGPGLQIPISFIRIRIHNNVFSIIRIRLFTLMRIRIQLFTLMRIRLPKIIQIQDSKQKRLYSEH
jgi:hypothetical protein